ncbi:MAG TPA: SGNH/GDSL hydrolase family protein [bacterium]|nr:SGNH/GDSL hydrolase family protein [bacterium]HPO09289.1 SGNH/GDSL hydrolase family protein [bacterium]HQO34117.1 SGNH/GDSL hydrolase family protein [bacterium]HQQ00457.1 SGNH/GDSL hydrolase family protein [bacterium]
MSLPRRTFVRLTGLGTLAALSQTAWSDSPNDKPQGETPMAVADKTTYLSRIITALKKQWPENRTVNIVCHGHSVPSGYFKTPTVDTFNAYPHLLHRSIKEVYPYCVSNVIVTAIGGENSQSGAERFQTQVLCHRPDVLTIDYALNDRGLGLASARSAWVSMIEKTLAANVKLLLMTPTPDDSHIPDKADEPLNQHAQQIRDLAAEYGVGLIDSLAGFDAYQKANGNVTDLLSQVNHPNRKGHDIVAKELFSWFSDQPYPLEVENWKSQ